MPAADWVAAVTVPTATVGIALVAWVVAIALLAGDYAPAHTSAGDLDRLGRAKPRWAAAKTAGRWPESGRPTRPRHPAFAEADDVLGALDAGHRRRHPGPLVP